MSSMLFDVANMTRPKLVFVPVAMLFVLVATLGSAAQEPTAIPPALADTPITVQAVEEQLKRAEAVTDLDDESKKKVIDLLRQALDQAKKSETFATQLGNFEATAKQVEERAESLKKKAREFKDAKPAVAEMEFDDKVSLPQLEQQLTNTELRAKELREKLTKADSGLATRAMRIKTIRERLIEAKRQLEELNKQGAALAGDSMQNSHCSTRKVLQIFPGCVATMRRSNWLQPKKSCSFYKVP